MMRKLTARERAEMRQYAAACPTKQDVILREWANQSAQVDLMVDCARASAGGTP